MFNHALALDLAYTAVEEACRLGAVYADARYELRQEERISVDGGALGEVRLDVERGLCLRVLVRGAWGFAALGEPNRHDVTVVARRAVEQARAAAVLRDRPALLAEAEPHRASFRTAMKVDPLTVPLEEKAGLLLELDARMRRQARVVQAGSRLVALRRRKVFVNSEGSELDQDLVHLGVSAGVTASDGRRIQRRSLRAFPDGVLVGRGWEAIDREALLARAELAAEEAVLLLEADEAPSRVAPVVLGAAHVAALLEATFGRVLDLDGRLGIGPGGVDFSVPAPDGLGSLELGSPRVNVVADARDPGAPGSYGFDDEGVEAQGVELVSGGRLVGFLASREAAQRVGLERASGTMRAGSWACPPAVVPSNLTLEAGDGGGLDDLVAGLEDGLLIEGAPRVSIDAGGEAFVAQGELGWEVRGGQRVRPLRAPVYRGRVRDLWRACESVGGPASWELFGRLRPVAGGAVVPTGLGAPPARFAALEVGLLPPSATRGARPARSPGPPPPSEPGVVKSSAGKSSAGKSSAGKSSAGKSGKGKSGKGKSGKRGGR